MRYWRFFPLLLSSMLLLAACSAPAETKLAPNSVLPAFLAAAAPRVREAYRFAAVNPHDLETVPCYCGCGSMGHSSNLSCFIKDPGTTKDTGTNWETVTFEEHAGGCGICVDIAQDVMRMKSEGKQPLEIRRAIDATYGSFGPSTDAPLPNG